MAGKALMVVGQKRFVQTMRKAGADIQSPVHGRMRAGVGKFDGVEQATATHGDEYLLFSD